MRDRENPKRLLSYNKGQVEWENAEIDSAILTRANTSQLRTLGDPHHTSIYLIFETPAQPRAGPFVIQNGIEELALRLFDKTNNHRARSLSAACMTSS